MTPASFQESLRRALDLHRAGRLAEAEPIYRRLYRAVPASFDVVHLLGTACLQQGKHGEAANLLAAAAKLGPQDPACAMRWGIALAATGRLTEAEKAGRRACELDPSLPEAWFHAANAVWALGRVEEAISLFERALALRPDYAEACERLGALLTPARGHAAAEPYFRRAVARDPNFARAWCNLGVCLLYLGQLSEALESFGRALAIDPKLGHAHAARGLALERCHDLPGAMEAYARALEINPANAEARSARLLTMQYVELSREALAREHRAFGQALENGGNAERRRAFPNSLEPSRRLRVGLLSPDLRRHAVASFLEPLLNHVDPAQFDLFLYHDHATVDEVSERLKARAREWRWIAGQSADAVEAAVRGDRIDILIDLAGHTGFNRLPLYARRLAPVQATYLGYPDTTGLSSMDYRLVDAITDPPGEADLFCTETLLRFSPTAWCYQPPKGADSEGRARSSSGPGLVDSPPDGRIGAPRARVLPSVTFGCFNNLAKITDPTLQLWAGILAKVEGSRLLLKGAGLGAPVLAAAFRKRLGAAGIDPARVDLRERTKRVADHLALYEVVDVALDTFPYHGTTTTCEALWMGVPVVTLAGDRHASRVGASLLTAIGHPEWIARGGPHYQAIAAELACDAPRRELLRSRLREEMRASPLMDHAGQAARFAAALRQMWTQWCGRAAMAA